MPKTGDEKMENETKTEKEESQHIELHTNTRAIARQLVEEIYFLKGIANQINQKLADKEKFLGVLYDRLLAAGQDDYAIADALNKEASE